MTDKPSYSNDCWSANGEEFNWRDLPDLLRDEDHLKPGDTVYRGVAEAPDPTIYVDADDVIELLGERAFDDGGEYADGWPEVSKEAEVELADFLKGWIRKHCPPTPFYSVKNSAPYVLTTADFEA